MICKVLAKCPQLFVIGPGVARRWLLPDLFDTTANIMIEGYRMGGRNVFNSVKTFDDMQIIFKKGKENAFHFCSTCDNVTRMVRTISNTGKIDVFVQFLFTLSCQPQVSLQQTKLLPLSKPMASPPEATPRATAAVPGPSAIKQGAPTVAFPHERFDPRTDNLQSFKDSWTKAIGLMDQGD